MWLKSASPEMDQMAPVDRKQVQTCLNYICCIVPCSRHDEVETVYSVSDFSNRHNFP